VAHPFHCQASSPRRGGSERFGDSNNDVRHYDNATFDSRFQQLQDFSGGPFVPPLANGRLDLSALGL